MLVLGRNVGESVLIGDAIEVRVLHVDGKGAKLGVIAPQQVRIVRAELARLNQEASRRWSSEALQNLAAALRR